MSIVTVGLVGTYPPTRCGIASFTESLDVALSRLSATETCVVRLVDPPTANAPALVTLDSTRAPQLLVNGDPSSTTEAAHMIDAACDAVIVQHEFGIYGGAEGADVLSLLSQISTPVILVLHTVLDRPSQLQRSIIEQAARLSDVVVVMSEGAENTLLNAYAVDDRRVRRIPHGTFAVPPRTTESDGRLRMLTWGLLGPGKGIEWAVMALSLLTERGVDAHYRIIGETHPKVREREGEQYRDMISRLAETLGVADRVMLINRYVNRDDLAREITEADLVVLPYDSRTQATSGVLAEALAARVPVVATSFPVAQEQIPHGHGWIVPHEDPVRLATALEQATRENARGGRRPWPSARHRASADWNDVALMYRRLVSHVTAKRTA